ncbi:hypothetical protein CEXT_734631 [Caerostris extrusa]|uniref:Uncharacterized protein n=1 Tax=Caerostris extrusa TaxID=172846 RepID=A0AAV4U2K8_CAEEX|nr:hypothetical protein CEXT_734631 [Caerostris extrusa]
MIDNSNQQRQQTKILADILLEIEVGHILCAGRQRGSRTSKYGRIKDMNRFVRPVSDTRPHSTREDILPGLVRRDPMVKSINCSSIKWPAWKAVLLFGLFVLGFFFMVKKWIGKRY